VWSVLSPASLPPGKRLGTHCAGGWVGPRASLDGCGNLSQHHAHNKVNLGQAILFCLPTCFGSVGSSSGGISGSYYSWNTSLNHQICYTLFKKLFIADVFSLR